MDTQLEEKRKKLLEKKKKAEEKLASARERLGHPHLDFMSAHDLAESEFNFWSSYLEQIEKELREIEKQKKNGQK